MIIPPFGERNAAALYDSDAGAPRPSYPMFGPLLRSLSIVALASASLAAHALLIDPTGGTDLTRRFSNPDDASLVRSLGGTFRLYERSIDQIQVNTNGYLSLGGPSNVYNDRTATRLAEAANGPIVAGLYDDLIVSDAGGIVESRGTGYYAVTYRLMNGATTWNEGRTSTFQIALFNAAGTFGGAALQAGDVVLSYDLLGHVVEGGSSTVGMAINDVPGLAAARTDVPFSVDGRFGSLASFTSHFDAATQGILFRYDPSTRHYVPSLIPLRAPAAPPAPGPAAALPFALMVLRRRKRARA